MRIRRSNLIVPANVERYIEKAHEIDADIVQLDLQDAVPKNEEAKQTGRRMACAAIRDGGFKASEVCARVNGPSTNWFLDDVDAVVEAGVDAIRLTHANGLGEVMYAEGCIARAAQRAGRRVEMHLAVDRPRTALELDAIGRESRLITLAAVSPGDYTLELGASLGPDRKLVGEQQLQYLRQQVLTVSRAMGWNASDSVGAGDPNDLDAVHAAMRRSRAMGFDGSAQLYPRHVAVANDAFAPSEEEQEWAADIIERFERIDPSRSVAVIDGRAIVPVYEYACRIREYARAVKAAEPEYRVEVLP